MDITDRIIMDVPLFIRMLEFAKEDAKDDMALHTATEKALKLLKNNNCLSMTNYDDIVNSGKIEAKESMGADAAGSFETSMSTPIVKRKFQNAEEEIKEVTDASSSGAYDVPFPGPGRKNPLSIGGPKTIHQRISTIKAKKFPMWVKGGTFVEVKPKCKKFPYCNQGDIHALNFYRGTVSEIANKYGITKSEVISIIMENIDIY